MPTVLTVVVYSTTSPYCIFISRSPNLPISSIVSNTPPHPNTPLCGYHYSVVTSLMPPPSPAILWQIHHSLPMTPSTPQLVNPYVSHIPTLSYLHYCYYSNHNMCCYSGFTLLVSSLPIIYLMLLQLNQIHQLPNLKLSISQVNWSLMFTLHWLIEFTSIQWLLHCWLWLLVCHPYIFVLHAYLSSYPCNADSLIKC